MRTVAVTPGDGIGPEIMDATLAVFRAAKVPVDFVPVEMGLSVWEGGEPTGITDEAKATVERLGVLFKGPMATPKGKGVKSINVTARKTWNTYANVRVFKTMPGASDTDRYPTVGFTMVRENIEDTYGAIEHMQTHDVAQCRRLITRPGSEQVVRFAFELARKQGIQRVTAGHKANIMKLTDGLFLDTFRRIAKEYPDIQSDDMIVDALAMTLVMRPEQFGVIVLPNLQGDILSDLAAGLVGGLPYAPSSNVGDHISIFEAVHGTAPDIAGQDLANPTALMLSGCMMLDHLGLGAWASRIRTTLEQALADGLGKASGFSTKAFAQALCDRIAAQPDITATVADMDIAPEPRAEARMMVSPRDRPEVTVGADLFIDDARSPAEVADIVNTACADGMSVLMISNRGTQVWPTGSVFTDCINHHRVRVESDTPIDAAEIYHLAARISEHTRVCSMEALIRIGDQRAYSLAQGQS